MEKPILKDSSSLMGWDLINDLSAIPENEDNIEDYLLYRLECGLIYTWVGPILLSLNPEENSTDLYHPSNYKDFFNATEVLQRDVKPHIFAIAARSHYRILNDLGRPSQLILISGDSGSGKTFNANQAINFLAAVNERSPELQIHGKKVDEFVGKIVSACPLITAFSTASTARNARSSRHGQLIRFEYENGVVSGTSIQSFLLERSRVTRGSDNFAVFYQLISGLHDSELKKLGLSKAEKYNIMGVNHYIQKDQLRQDFQETLKAFDAIGFSEDEKNEIFKIVALLIHLGNINFKQSNGDGFSEVDAEDEESRKALENACVLTSLSKEDLSELLTTTLICTQSQWRRHSTYRRNFSSIEICRNRLFSIIRHLYDNLFHWLIDRINQTLSSGSEHHNWLGILDIFGFESFARNGIEELCINYANERLQLYFIQEYLALGQRDLWKEGLSDLPAPDTINFYENRLSVIECYLFSTLNDASQSLVQCNPLQLKKQFLVPATSSILIPSQKDEAFIINHYSKSVEYSLQDLLSKNTDKVPCELTGAFSLSSNKLLKTLSEINEDQSAYLNNKIYSRKGTTLAKVKRSLDTLLKGLKKCDTHYVKCVRPRRIEGSWDKCEFREQLACIGVLDALPQARCKFPIRLNYVEFLDRYSRKKIYILNNGKHCKAILKDVVDEKDLASSVYFGKRLIFLSESLFFKLENQRKEYRRQCANKIYKFWKKYKLQKALNASTYGNRLSFIDSNLEKSSFSDKKSEINPSDYEDEAFMSIDNKDSSRIEVCDALLDVSESNTQFQEIKIEIKSQFPRISRDDTFHDHNYCPKIRHFKSIFVSQWVNGITATNDKETMTRPIKSTKAMSERQKLQLLRIQNSLHVEPNRKGSGYIVSFGHYTFFYKDRILSRQHLAEVPVRFHTRLTCLPYSHRLPRTELPQGLEDCL